MRSDVSGLEAENTFKQQIGVTFHNLLAHSRVGDAHLRQSRAGMLSPYWGRFYRIRDSWLSGRRPTVGERGDTHTPLSGQALIYPCFRCFGIG
jgi:hypothetical protein